jgi:hypothetical protein
MQTTLFVTQTIDARVPHAREEPAMHAAVVRSFERPPRYEDFEIPKASGEDEVVVSVLAAGLHPRVRSGAAGAHYADEKVLPMIPGIDAVGRLPDGTLAYCVVHDTPFGTMAEEVVADRRRCVLLPEGTDEAVVAAAMNPAISSWIALRLRAPIHPGRACSCSERRATPAGWPSRSRESSAPAGSSGRIPVDVARVPLADVEKAWLEPPAGGRRVVLVP